MMDNSKMFVLGVLCILSALTTTCSPLTCIECMSTNSTSCTGDAVTCLDGYECATSYTESTTDGSNTTTFIRSCSPSKLCNKTGSISTLYGNTKMSTSCCPLHNCTAQILEVPSVRSDPNGVTCPSCQSSSSGWCYEEKTVHCTGEETVCALYTTTIGGNISSIRGCARQSACSTQKYIVNGTNISYQSTCYCGANSSNTYCPDTNVTCPAGTICARVRTLSTVGQASSERNRTACLPIYQCGISGSTSFLGGTLRLMTICSTNNCSLTEPTWSNPNLTVNGVRCPTCMSSSSTWCKSQATIQCTGSETVCMVHTEKLSGTPSIMRGCSTRSNCYLGQLSHSANGSDFDFKFICPTGGYSISCSECMNSTSCMGSSVTCPVGSVCATSYMESTVGGAASTRVIRSCTPLSQCDRIGSISSPYGNITMSSSCCAFDNCSSYILPVSSVSTQPNGVTCPTCQSSSSGWCYNEQTVECTGEESVCVLYSTNIDGRLSSVRGCGRRTCGSEKYNVNGTGITYTSNCYCGGTASNTLCPGTNVSCPSGTTCARVHAVTTIGNRSIEINDSTCLPIYQCGIPGSSSFPNGTQRLVTICSTNGCNLPEPALTGPDPNSTYNGVTCPTCMSENSEWCTAEDTMQCIGSESICTVHSVKMMGTPSVIRGCATRSFCNLGRLTHFANGTEFDFKFICPTGGYNLSCSECMDSKTCTGTNVTCPSGSVCATSYMESIVGGSKSTRYIRSCAPSTQCDQTRSISTLYGKTKMSTSCCAFDNCSSSILPVPSVSSQPNGVTCPTCQSSSSVWCYEEKTVECTGDETACVLFSTNIDGSLSSIRGCTQQRTCRSQKYSVNETAITYQPTCYCGGNSSNTYCKDTNVTCLHGTICARVHALSTVGNTSVEINKIACLPIYQCGISGSASFLNGTLSLVTICSTDTCNLPDPALTGASSSWVYNGVTCPTCISENSEWCKAENAMQCSGSENVCLTYSSKLSGTPSVVRGCATRSNCYLAHLSHSASGSRSEFDFKFICPAGGYSLSCKECIDSTNCSGNSITCSSGNVCATSYTESTVGGSKSTRYIRSCAPPSQCDTTGSISTLDGNTKMFSSCCAFDNCSSSVLPVPPASTQLSGVTCSSCQSSSSLWCYNEQTLQCTGDENVCALYTTNIAGNVSSIRGCTRQSTCNNQRYTVNGIRVAYQSNCYCGGNSSNTYCPGTNTTCPSGTVCARVHSLTTVGNTSFENYTSTCLPVNQCGIPGSVGFLNGTVRLVTVCSTSDCNLPEPLLTGPEPTSSYNGVICPTCMAENSEWCNAKDTMNCVGNETVCLTYNAKFSGTPVVFRGCGTKTSCILSNLTHSTNGSEFDLKLDCSTKGHSLTCIECMSTNSTSCTGEAITCMEGYVCATSYTEATVGGFTRYVRSCAPQNLCNKIGSITTPYGTIKMSTSCCPLDNCNATILPVPPVNPQPNGVTCPACQSSSSGWCYDTQTVECSGDETVCALFSANINGSLQSVRGCARPSTCSSQKYNVNGTGISYQSTCYCGGIQSNTYCPDTNVTCPPGTICATVLSETTTDDKAVNIRKSACLPIYQCGISGTASFLNSTLRLVTICSTNNCNLPEPALPVMPGVNATSNGVTCPTCTAKNSDWCKAEDTMECVGSESICLLQTAKQTGTNSVFRGCATRSICYLGQLADSANGSQFDFKFICSIGGYTLSCTECMNTANSSCTGNGVTCSPGYVCATSYTESTVGGINSTRYIRSCAPQNQCDKAGSVSSLHSGSKTSTSCCASDNCSSSILPVSSTSSQPNGVTCSTCQEPSSSWCYNQETMQCRGEENVCVLYSTNIAGAVSSVRGCAQPDICNYQKYSVNGTRVVYQPTCYCGGNSSNTYCTDTNTTCPNGTICAKVYALTTVGNNSYETYKSTCLPINQCGIPGSVSTVNGTVNLVTICSTNDCSLPKPVLTGPHPNATYNGVTCPSCASENSEWCSSEDTMQCIGNETVCVIHSAVLSGTPMVFRGCATKTNCILSNLSHSAVGSEFDFQFMCLTGDNGGYSLSCPECMDSTYCTGNNVTCPPGYVCATSYHQATMGIGSTFTRYIRSCAPSSQCDVVGSITTSNGNTTFSTSCCAFDNCSSTIQPVKSSNSELNGVTCSTCQSSSSTWCHDTQTVQCRGEETVCVLHSTTIDGQSSAIRGCAQTGTCNSQTYTVNGESIVYQGICSCGGNASNTYCPDTNVTCPMGTICATVHALTEMGDASFQRFTSTCLPIYQCGVAGSATFLKGTMKLVTLCSTNNCNLPNASFSEENLIPNGVTCQDCMAADSNCYTSERRQCTGNENWCFFQASDLTEMASAKSAIRGCSTKNICDLGTQTYNALGIKSDVKYVCSSGGKHFLMSFFTPLMICTLILEYLF